MAHKIKVVMGTDIKREAVLIDPSVAAGDNPQTGAHSKNVIATGTTAAQLASTIYGRRK